MDNSKQTDAQDAELFRAAVGEAQPVSASARVIVRPPARAPLPVHSMRDEAKVLEDALHDETLWSAEVEIADEQSFLRTGLPRQLLRKLRQGRWSVQDELDLHGYSLDGARQALIEFFKYAIRRGLRCVRVVHGKGMRSPGGEPVLKTRVRAWLARRDEVLAYVEAPAAGGGSGAVVVLLRAGRIASAKSDPTAEDLP